MTEQKPELDGGNLFSRRNGLVVTYALCGGTFVAGALEQAFGRLMGFVFLGLLGVGLASLIHLVNLPFQIRRLGLRALIPLCICVAVFPAIRTIGPLLLRARFHWNHDEYEALALAIHAGTHPESLSGDESRLGRWVQVTHPGALDDSNEWAQQRAPCVDARGVAAFNAESIIAVHFMTVTHGLAGHVGFMRAFDDDAERCLKQGRGLDGWWYSKPLVGHWYIVGD